MQQATMTVRPPAKLNLGLEIVGQRPDGYHEIRSVMQTVSLCDELRLQLSESSQNEVAVIRSVSTEEPRLSLAGHELAAESNLVVRALRSLAEQSPQQPLPLVEIDLLKRIPPASGMGGASSDAAAALIFGNHLWGMNLPSDTLAHLARTLGADVPFFLRGGTALVSGIGEQLEPLPDLAEVWFVVVFPLRMNPIPRKTATLYRAMTPADWTTGERISALASRLRAGQPFGTEALRNAFERPLYETRPELPALREAMQRAGASCVALSGAGPTHYTVERDAARAAAVATALRDRLGEEALVQVVTPVPAGAIAASIADETPTRQR